MILSCFRCADDEGSGAQGQNKLYGSGMRVHNAAGTPRERVYRCVVCKTERSAGKQN